MSAVMHAAAGLGSLGSGAVDIAHSMTRSANGDAAVPFAERYHLGVALVAVLAGVAVAVADRWVPAVAPRAVAGAVLVGAAIGGRGLGGSLVWWGLCAALVLIPDTGTQRHPLGRWALPLVLVSVFGVWSAVPDTEPPLALACALAPLAVERVRRGVSVGSAATAALVVGTAGAVWVGSAGKDALLASVCALGMVLFAPLVAIGHPWRPTGAGWTVVVAVHVVVALTIPRLLIGMGTGAAALLGFAAFSVSGAVALAVSRSSALSVPAVAPR